MTAETAFALATLFQKFPMLKEHVGVASGSQENARMMVSRASLQGKQMALLSTRRGPGQRRGRVQDQHRRQRWLVTRRIEAKQDGA